MFNKKFLFILIYFFFFKLITLSFANNNYKILVSVNERSITQIDLLNEIKLLKILNIGKNIDQKEIKETALNNLIEENIKIEEIKNAKIDFNKEEIDKYYFLFINNNKIQNIDSLLKVLLKQKIQIDFQWNRLIMKNFYWKINVNVKEIEKKISQEPSNLKKNPLELEKIKNSYIENEKEKKLKVYSNYYLRKLKNKSLIKYF